MGSAGYVIGAVLVIAMAVFVVYMVPSSISANVLITNMKNNLLEKEVTLDVQWVGYNTHCISNCSQSMSTLSTAQIA